MILRKFPKVEVQKWKVENEKFNKKCFFTVKHYQVMLLHPELQVGMKIIF